MRRATRGDLGARHGDVISIHALHEESDQRAYDAQRHVHISIHALHEESDRQTRRPARQSLLISIHALREESDLSSSSAYCLLFYFNPRSP